MPAPRRWMTCPVSGIPGDPSAVLDEPEEMTSHIGFDAHDDGGRVRRGKLEDERVLVVMEDRLPLADRLVDQPGILDRLESIVVPEVRQVDRVAVDGADGPEAIVDPVPDVLGDTRCGEVGHGP